MHGGMITFLRGTLMSKTASSPRGAYFIVDLHGMGMEVLSTVRSVESSGAVGEQVLLHTSLIVREDSMSLVGFNTQEERDLFNILQSASGVGVKVALALLSSLSVSEIAQSVVSGNYKPLTAAKGVGPKLAQKIALELKEKMMSWREMAIETVHAGELPMQGEAFIEAETVLLSLGYTREEVLKSLKAIQDSVTAQDSSEIILRESLRWLASV
jgi:Holliday junction DNA helicase RuvA